MTIGDIKAFWVLIGVVGFNYLHQYLCIYLTAICMYVHTEQKLNRLDLNSTVIKPMFGDVLDHFQSPPQSSPFRSPSCTINSISCVITYVPVHVGTLIISAASWHKCIMLEEKVEKNTPLWANGKWKPHSWTLEMKTEVFLCGLEQKHACHRVGDALTSSRAGAVCNATCRV